MNQPSLSPLADFLQELTFEGRAVIRSDLHRHPATAEDRQATGELLQRIHCIAVQEAPGAAPELCLPSAVWGTEVLAWGCGMLVDRGETEIHLPDWLASSQPPNQSQAHWSVDLSLRFGAGLVKRAHAAAASDPWFASLLAVFQQWPLSSVGIDVTNSPESIAAILAHRSLSQMFVDRMIVRRDLTRLRMAQFRSWIDGVAGSFPDQFLPQGVFDA